MRSAIGNPTAHLCHARDSNLLVVIISLAMALFVPHVNFTAHKELLAAILSLIPVVLTRIHGRALPTVIMFC